MTSMNMNTNTKSMTAALQQAISENNTGTRLIRHCHYDEAVKSFTSVLQILKPLAAIVEDQHKHKHNHKHATNNNTTTTTTTIDATATASTTSSIPLKISFNNKSIDTDDDDNSTDDYTIGTTTQIQSSSPVKSSSSSSSSSPVPDTTASTTASTTTPTRKLKHFVFRDPVVIPPECIPTIAKGATTLTDNDNDNDIYYSPVLFSKFLMIVMYNLALTLHLQAIAFIAASSSLSRNTKTKRSSNRKKIKKLLVRSRTLYELAFDMHLENTAVEQDECTLFTLALTNNLGLIYQITNDTHNCTSCFQNMFSTMMYLLDSSHQYHDHEGFSSVQSSHRKEWNGMFSNAMDILFTHTYEVTAAAA